MKAGWQTRMLADICDVFADGDWVESKDQSPKGIRLIQTGNVGEGLFKDRGEKARYISEATFKRLRCTEIFEGDCLISRLPDPAGRSCLLPDTGERMITAVDCTIVRFNPKQVIPAFFNYYSQSHDYLSSVDAETTGTTRKRISRSKLGQTIIPVPPLPKQQRIVGILDEAFDGIATAKANAEKNLQNARALFESHLQSVFTQRGEEWVKKPLGDSFTTATGNTPPKNNADFYGDFMPLVKPPELCDSAFDSAADGLSEAGAAVARTLPSKSILVSCIGNLGKIGLNTVPVAFNQQINAILPDENQAIPEFMFFQVLSSAFKEQLEALASGTTVPIVNKSKFNSVKVVLPSLPRQKVIVAQLGSFREETQRLESLYQRKLAGLDSLKKSLLHQAFTGQL